MNPLRRSLVLLAALIVVPFVAHADQQDLLSGTVDVTHTFSFILPASPTPYEVVGPTWDVTGVDVTFDGTMTSGLIVEFFPSLGGASGGFQVLDQDGYDAFNELVLTQGPQVFTGSSSAPTLVPGTYTFEGYHTGDVTISEISPTSATPEPSSLLLLGTGLFGAAGLARRKLRRA